mmetsp:Transcript_78407/g.237830  ORF Transcript_78407/g.237830 Transcript_78407/m.237830 type:complete len:140 (-) Transcript_78407:160-579(-)
MHHRRLRDAIQAFRVFKWGVPGAQHPPDEGGPSPQPAEPGPPHAATAAGAQEAPVPVPMRAGLEQEWGAACGAAGSPQGTACGLADGKVQGEADVAAGSVLEALGQSAAGAVAKSAKSQRRGGLLRCLAAGLVCGACGR